MLYTTKLNIAFWVSYQEDEYSRYQQQQKNGFFIHVFHFEPSRLGPDISVDSAFCCSQLFGWFDKVYSVLSNLTEYEEFWRKNDNFRKPGIILTAFKEESDIWNLDIFFSFFFEIEISSFWQNWMIFGWFDRVSSILGNLTEFREKNGNFLKK